MTPSARPAIEPRRWNPPKAPDRARRSTGPTPFELRTVDLPGSGPEDVVLDAQGRVITGLADGRILRIDTAPAGAPLVEIVGDTGGRPLGLDVVPDGLLVCDADRGLLHLDPDSGTVRVLTDRVVGAPLRLCSNCVAAPDGTIYFDQSSQRLALEYFTADLLEHASSGRLMRRDPDGTVEVILEGLDFANGLVLAPDRSWIAVAQTGGYCITRLWLTGPRQGQHEPLVDNLPGFPDNLGLGSDGLIWVAIASPREPMLDFMLPRAPALRRLVWALPPALRPKPANTAWVQAYDLDGTLIHDLQTTHPRFSFATGVAERDGTVWIGSFTADCLARIDL